MQGCWLDVVAMVCFLARQMALKVKASLLTLPYELCSARPLLVPGKLAQVAHSRRVLGNHRSKADAFSSSVNPEAHSAIRRVSCFSYQTRDGDGVVRPFGCRRMDCNALCQGSRYTHLIECVEPWATGGVEGRRPFGAVGGSVPHL